MAAELDAPAVQDELSRWTLVYLDLDEQADETEELAVTGVPALRLRTPGGQHVADRDGYLTADELVAWLKEHHAEAVAAADDALLVSGKPDALAVVRLVRQFSQRNPALREAAIRRLAAYPDVAGTDVVKAFRKGSLAARLAAREVLEQWKAPLEGLDPWKPETLSTARLERWLEDKAVVEDRTPRPLTPAQLASARQQIDRMLKAGDEAEADAVRQRLAGLGASLLPEVYARLKDAVTDQDRRRLLALRYRLAATDALALSWPGGIERLAEAEPRRRRQAAEELAKMAGRDEQPLLLELFADPDPMVREISIRGLQQIGGKQANAALVKLLGDPEPNVRAAVLKQLEETPSSAMIPAVVKYLEGEKDPDLVVHGIRCLHSGKGPEVVRCLMALLKHPSWQVRAEAAAAIGKLGESGRGSYQFDTVNEGNNVDADTQLKVSAYVALLDLLTDADAFVIAKAVEGLAGADMAVAVEPLARAAETHPELADNILKILGSRETCAPRRFRTCGNSVPIGRRGCGPPPLPRSVRPPAPTSIRNWPPPSATRKAASAWPAPMRSTAC